MAMGHEDQRVTGETGFLKVFSDHGEGQVQSCPKSPHVTSLPEVTIAQFRGSAHCYLFLPTWHSYASIAVTFFRENT